MYDAYEKDEALKDGMKLIEQIRDKIAGMGYFGLENDLDDLMADFDLERRDLQDDIAAANREQEEEDEQEYLASCY